MILTDWPAGRGDALAAGAAARGAGVGDLSWVAATTGEARGAAICT